MMFFTNDPSKMKEDENLYSFMKMILSEIKKNAAFDLSLGINDIFTSILSHVKNDDEI